MAASLVGPICEEKVGLTNINILNLERPHDDELGISSGPWPRYLAMTDTDEGKSFNNRSPFAIHKGIAGGDVTIKCQFNTDIY